VPHAQPGRQQSQPFSSLSSILLRRLRSQYGWLWLGLFLAILQSALAVPIALLLRWAFDEAIPHRQTNHLLLVGAAVLALRATSSLVACVAHNINLAVTRRFSRDLRRDLLDKAFTLPRHYYQQAEPGAVQDVLTYETERVDVMVRALLSQVCPSAVLSLALALVLVALDLRLFGVMLLVWPITWLVNEFIRRRVVRATRTYNLVLRRYNEQFRWLIDSLDFVRTQHAESLETQRGQSLIEEVDQAIGPMSSLNMTYLQLQTVLLAGVSLVVLLLGGTQVSQGRMSLGNLLSFFTVVSILNASLRDVAAGLYHVFVGTESMRNILNLLAATEKNPYAGTQKIDLLESLELVDVSFCYDPSQPLLQDVSFKLEAHRWVALMGPNGCGKSTVLSLLLGFISPDQGCLRADGTEYGVIEIGHLRAQLGVVAQDPHLFAGSILENIRYGYPHMTEEQVVEALRVASADDWVFGLPSGIHTLVGEAGQMLSGGQRQKLAIARAILRRPRFLILDEPTNHLDLRSIVKVLENLRGLAEVPAVLIVTHDEGVAREVDCVYRVDLKIWEVHKPTAWPGKP